MSKRILKSILNNVTGLKLFKNTYCNAYRPRYFLKWFLNNKPKRMVGPIFVHVDISSVCQVNVITIIPWFDNQAHYARAPNHPLHPTHTQPHLSNLLVHGLAMVVTPVFRLALADNRVKRTYILRSFPTNLNMAISVLATRARARFGNKCCLTHY